MECAQPHRYLPSWRSWLITKQIHAGEQSPNSKLWMLQHFTTLTKITRSKWMDRGSRRAAHREQGAKPISPLSFLNGESGDDGEALSFHGLSAHQTLTIHQPDWS
jgi:hypothetical protein